MVRFRVVQPANAAASEMIQGRPCRAHDHGIPRVPSVRGQRWSRGIFTLLGAALGIESAVGDRREGTADLVAAGGSERSGAFGEEPAVDRLEVVKGCGALDR